MNAKPVVFPGLLLAFLLNCEGKGPLEKKLDQSFTKYAHTLSEYKIDPGYKIVLEEHLPNLSEKTYEDPADIKNKKRISYRTSILLSAVIYRLSDSSKARESSRELFMNAYLQDKNNALKDLRKLLGRNAELKDFRSIRIPDYTSRDTFHKLESGKYEKTKSDKLNPDKAMQSVVTLKESMPYYLLQMISGDLLYKNKDSRGLGEMKITFQIQGKDIAYSSWDKKDDTIHVHLK